MTVGPWKAVTLQSYKTRIANFRISTVLDQAATDSTFLQANVSFEVDGSIEGVTATTTLSVSEAETCITCDPVSLELGKGVSHFCAKPGEIDLWYPTGFGKQALHRVELTIKDAVRAIKSIFLSFLVKLFCLLEWNSR